MSTQNASGHYYNLEITGSARNYSKATEMINIVILHSVLECYIAVSKNKSSGSLFARKNEIRFLAFVPQK